jgi:hypothetical protein
MTHDEYWRYYAKQNRKMEKIGVRIMSEAIKTIVSDVIASIEQIGATNTLRSLETIVQRPIIDTAYRSLYDQVGYQQFIWAQQDINKRYPSLTKEERQPIRRVTQPRIGQNTDLGVGFFNPQWLTRLRDITASVDFNERISSVTDNISKKIAKSLTESVQTLVTTRKIIAKLRRDVGEKWTRARASLIARTEVTYISNLAAEQAAKELKVDLKKIWVRTLDSRTRDAHRNVTKQAIDADKKFMVGGLPMDKPGDPAGGISNTARCRCVVAYLLKEDDEDIDDYEI